MSATTTKPLVPDYDYRTPPSLKHAAREYLSSRGFGTLAKEEHKLRLLALLIRDGHIDEHRIVRASFMASSAFSVARQVLSSVGILREEHIPGSRRFVFVGESLPAHPSHYLAPGHCWVQVAAYDLRADKKAARPVKYTCRDEALDGSKRSIQFGPEGGGAQVTVPIDSAFRTYARLKRLS